MRKTILMTAALGLLGLGALPAVAAPLEGGNRTRNEQAACADLVTPESENALTFTSVCGRQESETRDGSSTGWGYELNEVYVHRGHCEQVSEDEWAAWVCSVDEVIDEFDTLDLSFGPAAASLTAESATCTLSLDWAAAGPGYDSPAWTRLPYAEVIWPGGMPYAQAGWEQRQARDMAAVVTGTACGDAASEDTDGSIWSERTTGYDLRVDPLWFAP